MSSLSRRTSSLSRFAASAGIGAFAIVTGACSGDGGSDVDSGASTDVPAEAAQPADAITDSDTPADATEDDTTS